MPIDPASGGGATPRSGAQRLADIRQLARVIQGSKAPSVPRFTKGYVAALDGNVPTQTVSIYIDGDTSTLISGVTFGNCYKYPMVGDTVIVARQGADTLILDKYTAGGDCLAHVLLGADSAVFISIPANNYSHLKLYVVGGCVGGNSNGFNDLTLQFNADSGSDYSRHFGYALNSGTWAVSSVPSTTYVTGGFLPASLPPATAGGFCVIDIPFYQRASLSKQITFESHASSGIGAPNNFQFGTGGGIWGNSQGAITSILLATSGSPSTLTAGSEVYVFGV